MYPQLHPKKAEVRLYSADNKVAKVPYVLYIADKLEHGRCCRYNGTELESGNASPVTIKED